VRTGFLRNAAAAPDRVALVIGAEERTYGQLERTARTWAAALLDGSGGRPERIGVFAYRSEVAYTGTLAALFAGAAFVPLNRNFPPRRTAEMAQDARLDALIVDRESAAQLPAVWQGLAQKPLVLAPESAPGDWSAGAMHVLHADALARTRPLEQLPPVQPEDLVYLLFTSGSTGRPKGVAVTHANVLHFLDAIGEQLRITADDRFSQTFDQTFDPSIFDLFLAWEHGARVCAMRAIDLLAPVHYVNRNGITVWASVPAIPALMRKKNLLREGSMPSLRHSLFCGEPLPVQTAEEWQRAAPASAVYNYYGPTELTVVCLGHRWDAQTSPSMCRNGQVPIGRLFQGLSAVLLGDDGAAVGASEEGELCVAGPQVVQGYWMDPEKTRAKFVELAISETTTKRFYRTGDRAVRLENGEYIYLGRADQQIKLMGRRVELGEIEAVLAECEGVAGAVAIPWPIEDGHPVGVVAFLLGDGIDPESVRARAVEYLPGYMVPTVLHMVDEWPLNPNGKIDRNELARRLGQPASRETSG
jgi:amino acid adenylation domain-containing protein